MKKKISLSIVTLLILILVLNHNEKPVQQHLLSQPEENPYQSLHTMLNNEDFYQRLIELPKVENAEIEIEKMLENDTDEIEKNNLKCKDGISIYRLNENAKEENILIRYIPKEYTWKNLYTINNSLVNEYGFL